MKYFKSFMYQYHLKKFNLHLRFKYLDTLSLPFNNLQKYFKIIKISHKLHTSEGAWRCFVVKILLAARAASIDSSMCNVLIY